MNAILNIITTIFLIYALRILFTYFLIEWSKHLLECVILVSYLYVTRLNLLLLNGFSAFDLGVNDCAIRHIFDYFLLLAQ